MTSITYNTDIPLSTDIPAISQAQFRTNCNAIQTIWGEDHINFNVGAGLNSGQHKFVNFNGINAPATPTPNNSVLYPVAGIANTANAELRFKNQNTGIPPIAFPASLIRAYGVFDQNGNAVSLQNINLLCSGPAANIYTLTIATGAVAGATAQFGVLATAANVIGGSGQVALTSGYTYLTPNTFTLSFGLLPTLPANGFTCIVFQL